MAEEDASQKLSSSALNIHQRINGVMSDLHYIAKGDKTVNGAYRFVSHDQVAEKVQPLLVKWGINIIPNMESMTQDGNRTTVTVQLAFVNIENPSDCFITKWYAYGIDGGGYDKDGRERAAGDKGPGKGISYACKYGILKTFNLMTGEDPDFNAHAAYEPAKCQEFDLKVTATLSAAEKKKLVKFLASCATATSRHVEDVKREALTRLDQFLYAFKNWKGEKDESTN